MAQSNRCPNCGSADMHTFYEIKTVPVHSVVLLHTRNEAVNFPNGDITLGYCQTCSFITNVSFDSGLHDYFSNYESTQSFSPIFNAFAKRLAGHLIERFNLRQKRVIEIGCGHGEFLTLLCEMGNNEGIGFDPAYIQGRVHSDANDHITFIKDYYSEKYANYQADFVCCKMTLEHIQQTADFVSMVRQTIGVNRDTVVFFQVPDVSRILNEVAFWDIFYEHCSYFCSRSLGNLFQSCGFDVIDLWKGYNDQYLMIEARPGDGKSTSQISQNVALHGLSKNVSYFSENVTEIKEFWKQKLDEYRIQGKKTVIWGASSKGVSFLTSLGISDQIQYAVDINPYKKGTFIPGSGQEIVSPEFLKEYNPDHVIVMNSNYINEVSEDLSRMGLNPSLLAIESPGS